MSAKTDFWSHMERPGPEHFEIGGRRLGRGSRVRLRPGPGGDIMDVALDGRTGCIVGIDQDDEGKLHVAVVLESDPGRDLGEARMPAHRFYFAPAELEALPDPPARPRVPRILVAGIGNIFMGDDGFGVHVARRLIDQGDGNGITVKDFGIRGMDLAYTLADYDAAILIDAVPRGGSPGTLYLIEALAGDNGEVSIDTHAMDPARVLALAASLGPLPARVLVIGCEPLRTADPDGPDVLMELSPPVEQAVEKAVSLAQSTIAELLGTMRRDSAAPSH